MLCTLGAGGTLWRGAQARVVQHQVVATLVQLGEGIQVIGRVDAVACPFQQRGHGCRKTLKVVVCSAQ